MADGLRSQQEDDSGRGDWETRQTRQSSRSFRALRSFLSILELNVITCVYVEGLTVKETALVLRIGECGVKSMLWRITERFCDD